MYMRYWEKLQEWGICLDKNTTIRTPEELLLIMKADFVACFIETNIGHDGGYNHVVFQLSDLF